MLSDSVPVDVVAAVDIGGTNTVYSLVGRDGTIYKRGTIATRCTSDFKEYVSIVASRIRAAASGYTMHAIGIGAPNGNYFNGTIEFAPNLPWRGVLQLAYSFTEVLDVPAFVTNDANAAALGEKYFGAAQEMDDFIFITLGTGLGSGIVAGGQLIYGHDGFAGELGHTIVFQHGRLCGCGRRGCLEQYCSATGLVKTYVEIVRQAGEDLVPMENNPELNAKSIFDKANAGDSAARDAFNYTGEVLGFALANSVAYTSPEAIFLFGGLATAGEMLFSPVINSFEKNLLTIYHNKVKILPSGLPENDAALLGAASLAWNELFKS